jgi:hypothetical protein
MAKVPLGLGQAVDFLARGFCIDIAGYDEKAPRR